MKNMVYLHIQLAAKKLLPVDSEEDYKYYTCVCVQYEHTPSINGVYPEEGSEKRQALS